MPVRRFAAEGIDHTGIGAVAGDEEVFGEIELKAADHFGEVRGDLLAQAVIFLLRALDGGFVQAPGLGQRGLGGLLPVKFGKGGAEAFGAVLRKGGAKPDADPMRAAVLADDAADRAAPGFFTAADGAQFTVEEGQILRAEPAAQVFAPQGPGIPAAEGKRVKAGVGVVETDRAVLQGEHGDAAGNAVEYRFELAAERFTAHKISPFLRV